MDGFLSGILTQRLSLDEVRQPGTNKPTGCPGSRKQDHKKKFRGKRNFLAHIAHAAFARLTPFSQMCDNARHDILFPFSPQQLKALLNSTMISISYPNPIRLIRLIRFVFFREGTFSGSPRSHLHSLRTRKIKITAVRRTPR
jgi:hypothetical protein